MAIRKSVYFVGFILLIILLALFLKALGRQTKAEPIVLRPNNSNQIVGEFLANNCSSDSMTDKQYYNDFLDEMTNLKPANEIFKTIQQASLKNDKCGAVISYIMYKYFYYSNNTNKATEIGQRILKFASMKNPTAIGIVCINPDILLSEEATAPYCETVYYSDDANYSEFKRLAAIKLTGAYYKTGQAKKLADFCDDAKNELACYLPLINLADEYDEQKKYDEAFLLRSKAVAYDTTGVTQSELAEMYLSGQGTPKNSKMAIFWFQNALDKINSSSLRAIIYNDMGAAYEDSMNYVAAFKSYYQAATMGLAWSQMNLARLYDQGRGTLQDNKEAYAWISLAIAQGLENSQSQADAEQFKSKLTFKLSLQDNSGTNLKEAQELAQLYYKKYILHEQ